jgi:hypothetical protein
VNYDDEELMAYADGELDDARRAEIAAAVARDPDLAKRVDAHRALRARVSGAFAPVLAEAVPDKLRAVAISGRGTVVQFRSAVTRDESPQWPARTWMAMAASLVVGLLIAWRVFSPTEPLMVAGGDALLARGVLAAALDTQLASNQSRESDVLIGLTFRSRDGTFCRSFALPAQQTAGLACRAGEDWRIAATAVTELPSGEIRQAGSALPAAIAAAIEERIAGEVFDAAAERDAQARGWSAGR